MTSVESSEGAYSFQNEKATLSCDLIDQPKTVEGVVEKIWNNAGAWVGLAGEIGTSAINGQVGFMARFGAFTAYVNEPVTLKKTVNTMFVKI